MVGVLEIALITTSLKTSTGNSSLAKWRI